MDVNQTPPERMTAEQRRQEVATLLAHGIARLTQSGIHRSKNHGTESEFELAIPSGRSVHEVSNQRRKSEPK
jgi:hypothetical protein